MWWKRLLRVAALVALGVIVVLALMSLFARRPSNLGAHDGRLSPCPASPNCVCSQDEGAHHVGPFTYAGDPKDEMTRLAEILAARPDTRLKEVTDTYIHAECVSRLFRFVDDLEFLLDARAGVIQVRSASRTGYYDFGVNRRRVEAIRKAFERPR